MAVDTGQAVTYGSMLQQAYALAGSLRAAAAGKEEDDTDDDGRGLHSSTSQLNLSLVGHKKAPSTPKTAPSTPLQRATQPLRATPIPYKALKLS